MNTNIKVEIQGLDTSKLPKLSAKNQMEMLYRIKNGETELYSGFNSFYGTGSKMGKEQRKQRIQRIKEKYCNESSGRHL